jgi:hypothetical protein
MVPFETTPGCHIHLGEGFQNWSESHRQPSRKAQTFRSSNGSFISLLAAAFHYRDRLFGGRVLASLSKARSIDRKGMKSEFI